MKRLQRSAIALTCCLFAWLPAQQTNAQISQIPLYLGGGVEPNIMFTLDDSGSMHWELMPDAMIQAYYMFPRQSSVYGGSDYTNYAPDFDSTGNPFAKASRASAVNAIYYNPNITYQPWSKADGTLMDDAPPACAPHNPYNPNLDGGTANEEYDDCRNFTHNNTQWAYWVDYDGDDWNSSGTSKTFWPAVYYIYTGPASFSYTSSTSPIWDNDNYTQVEIRSSDNSYTKGAGRTDCAGSSCTYAEEIQNFANWYTYYRSRVLLARAGVGRAFASQGAGIRVGFAAINEGSQTVDGVSSPGALVEGVRKFTGSERTNFFSALYGHTMPAAGTPLRRALDDVGQYFKRTDNRGPWGQVPGTNDTGVHLSCRQNYNILMSDGYWNSSGASTSGATNADDTNGPTITGPDNPDYQYTPANPYQDGYSDTLADVAMYYWNRDLRTDLTNDVPVNLSDPAFWQHLVNFTVGLGVKGTLDPDNDLGDLTDGTKSWPQATSSAGPANVDDMWHAAVNSRGDFYSASNPVRFAQALTDTLTSISQRTASSSSIATNSTRLNSSTFVYQARFDSADWHGELLAYRVNQATGDLVDADTSTIEIDPIWEAGSLLDALPTSSRKIVTYDSSSGTGTGVNFLWNDLSANHQALLNVGPSGTDTNGQARLDYLRGDRSNEGVLFRTRGSRLGDIVNSDPWFVGQQDFAYEVLPGTEGSSYVTFRNSSAYSSRTSVVYAGANDGMLHAFHGINGRELFAYIPEFLFADLWKLTDPLYAHLYYVDGPPKGWDAYIASSWKTVLVGTAGAGARGLFALDVTDPSAFSASSVLWEFTPDDDDANADNSPDGDLGNPIGGASVVRLKNGQWAAIFGNGYASPNQHAVLFVVNAADGSLIKKIDTGVGSSGSPNGLSSPSVVDINDDRIADRVYAGDVHGNLWVFDISDNNTANWKIAYQSSGVAAPMFKAEAYSDTSCSTLANSQSITSQPQVQRHPKGGMQVFFGTGKYYEVGDGALSDHHSFYSLWDETYNTTPTPIPNRCSLLQQTITHESIVGTDQISDKNGNKTTNPFPEDVRASTDTDINWSSSRGWFMDLKSPVLGWEGERVVSAPLLREDRVIFTTMIPSSNACEYGGSSWLMELEAVSGSQLPVTPFDLNGDGVFDANDYIEIKIVQEDGTIVAKKVPASGKRSKAGMIKTPAVIRAGDKEYKYASGSTGSFDKTLESRSVRLGRQSWRQLR